MSVIGLQVGRVLLLSDHDAVEVDAALRFLGESRWRCNIASHFSGKPQLSRCEGSGLWQVISYITLN